MENYPSTRTPRHRLPALRTFEAVSRHLSVTRAAEELFVTVGAVSQQVRQLEEALGVPLLERHHRRVSLTADGAKLAACLTSCFERVDKTIEEISGQASRLSLRLMPTFATRWLMPRLPSFFGAHPGIEVDMSTVSGAGDPSLSNVDFSVRLGTGTWDDAESDLLFVDSLIPVCSPALARAMSRPADIAELALLHSTARHEAWQVWLEAMGLPLDGFRKHMKFGNAALACQAAIDGLGMTVTQFVYVKDDIAAGRLAAPFAPYGRPGWGYYLVCPKHKASWPNVALFRQWVRKVASDAAAPPITND